MDMACPARNTALLSSDSTYLASETACLALARPAPANPASSHLASSSAEPTHLTAAWPIKVQGEDNPGCSFPHPPELEHQIMGG